MLARRISFQGHNSDGENGEEWQTYIPNLPQRRARIIEEMGRPPMASVSGFLTFFEMYFVHWRIGMISGTEGFNFRDMFTLPAF